VGEHVAPRRGGERLYDFVTVTQRSALQARFDAVGISSTRAHEMRCDVGKGALRPGRAEGAGTAPANGC
jgi:hypothetical protein